MNPFAQALVAARWLLRRDGLGATNHFESGGFIRHLGPHHRFDRVMIVSGDREAEVRRLAATVSVTDVHAGVSPEEKLAIVRAETARAGSSRTGSRNRVHRPRLVANSRNAFANRQCLR